MGVDKVRQRLLCCMRWVLLVSFKWFAQPNISVPSREGFFIYNRAVHAVRAISVSGESFGQTLRP